MGQAEGHREMPGRGSRLSSGNRREKKGLEYDLELDRLGSNTSSDKYQLCDFG